MSVHRGRDRRPGEIGNAEHQSRFSEASTRELKAFAREHDLTVHTVAQGAWALLLSAYSGDDDVVYGAALAGRSPSLPGAMRIPGLFINTLPIRVPQTTRICRSGGGFANSRNNSCNPASTNTARSPTCRDAQWPGSQVSSPVRRHRDVSEFPGGHDARRNRRPGNGSWSIELVSSQEQLHGPLDRLFHSGRGIRGALCLRPESI